MGWLRKRAIKRVLRRGTYDYFDEVFRQLNFARSVAERDGTHVTWHRLVQAHRRAVNYASKRVPAFWGTGEFHLLLLGSVLMALEVDGELFDDYLMLRMRRADRLLMDDSDLDRFDEKVAELGFDGWLRDLTEQARDYYEDEELRTLVSRYEDVLDDPAFRDTYRREQQLARRTIEVPPKRKLHRALNRANDRIRP